MKSDDGQSVGGETARSSEPPVLSPAPSALVALIAFDPKTRQVLVLDNPDIIVGVEKDSTIEYEGRSLTILEKCSNREEATKISKLKAASMGAIGVDGCNYEESNGSSMLDEEEGGEGKDESPADANDDADSTLLNSINITNSQETYHINDAFAAATSIESNAAFRELLSMVMNDIDADIRRLMQRQQALREVMIKHLATGNDGRILETFEPRTDRLFIPTSKVTSRASQLPSSEDISYMQRLLEQKNRKRYLNDEEEEEYTVRSCNKRPRLDLQESGNPFATAPQIGRAGSVLRYPYISKEIEEGIFHTCQNSSSLYAQKLGRLLFADSLHLYFKDQNPMKRQWIHEAVDFRFPSEDKASQLLKWKNASFAINKNMKLSNQKDDSRGKEIAYTYLDATIEEDIFKRFPRDPIKYAEFMALRLFEGQLDRFFKDQDPKKKEWLRECVDRRYPMSDKLKRDQRWKICAVACNKNRTKILADDGTEAEYPYFAQHLEEEAFKKAQGVPYVYAEKMSQLLFPETPHLLFKDQDLGKRNWLHKILDKRFPTPDKFDQTAKWKSCTSAINKTAYRAADQKSSSPADTNSRLSNANAVNSSANEKEKKETNSEKENSTTSATSSGVGGGTKTSRDKEKERKETEKEAPKRESSRIHGKTKKEKLEPFTSYPYVSESEELQIFERMNGNLAKYAKELTRIIFKDSLHLYFKDQDPRKRQWVKSIIDFRFPTKNALEYKQTWKNAGAAINSNMAGAIEKEKETVKEKEKTAINSTAAAPVQGTSTRLTRSSRLSL